VTSQPDGRREGEGHERLSSSGNSRGPTIRGCTPSSLGTSLNMVVAWRIPEALQGNLRFGHIFLLHLSGCNASFGKAKPKTRKGFAPVMACMDTFLKNDLPEYIPGKCYYVSTVLVLEAVTKIIELWTWKIAHARWRQGSVWGKMCQPRHPMELNGILSLKKRRREGSLPGLRGEEIVNS